MADRAQLRRKPLWPTAAIWCLMVPWALAADENWARFRGPNGAGLVAHAIFPAEWSDDDYLWKRPLPGRGHSSPVGWGQRIFVTCADDATGDTTLLCFDAATGEQLWERTLPGEPFAMHRNNSYASATPAVDGSRIYLSSATPARTRLVALTHDGEYNWQQDFGGFVGEHGFASSPIVVDDLVCLECHEADQGFLVGVDAATGDVRWRAVRAVGAESYATPSTLWLPSGRRAVISQSTSGGISAVDVQTGDVALTMLAEFPTRCVSSPLVAGDLILGACGGGGGGKLLRAVRLPGKQGDSPMEWLQLTKNVPYVPCPLVKDSLLFLWHDQGRVTCLDLDDGAAAKPLWTERVGGNYYGSPILAGDKLYCLSVDGVAVVLAAGRHFALLGKNELGAPTNSTPAVHRGRMFLRTDEFIACLPPLPTN